MPCMRAPTHLRDDVKCNGSLHIRGYNCSVPHE
jgi:hypothetical protein